MPFFRIVDCQTFFAEYFCHMVVLLNIILRNGKLPNGKIAEGCCGMTYTQYSLFKIINFANLVLIAKTFEMCTFIIIDFHRF